MPNHHRNAKAKSGDFVSAIVEHTTSGLSKNISKTANLANVGVCWVCRDCCDCWDCCDCCACAIFNQGLFKKRFALAATHQAANTNCIKAKSIIPASLESVKYRETAVVAP